MQAIQQPRYQAFEMVESVSNSKTTASALDRIHKRWAALAVLLAGTILSPIDFFIVNVALPSIQTSLHASSASIQLVLSGYAAAYAAFLIMGGRLGDIYGRRLVFLVGLTGFGAVSLFCGTANSPQVLVVSRVIQGFFAAVLMPQSLAAIRVLFPESERPRALGFYAATFGLGAIVGQVLGGMLITANFFGLGWRSIFLINLPVIALIIPFACILLKENRDASNHTLDLGGVALLAAALAALVLPLVEGREQNWPWWTIVLLSFSPLCLFIFWHYEQWIIKQEKEPLFIPALFESPGLVRGLMAAFFYNAFATFFLIFSIYEQAARGSNPLQAGLAVLPLGIGYALSPLLSPWLIRVAGNRAVTYATLLLAGGMFCTAATASIGTSWTLIPSLFLIGLGQGLGLPTLIRTVVERVDGHWAGLGAGLVNSVLQISGSLSVALIGGLFYMVLPNQISPNAITHAFSISASAIGLSLVVSAALVNSVGSIYTRNTLTDGEIHH